VEAAFAGALDVRLGGANRYGDDVQDRGQLGDGRPPEPPDVLRALRLANRVDLLALVLAVTAARRSARPDEQALDRRRRTHRA
jgi:adenosylcobinamide-phosphate synthase